MNEGCKQQNRVTFATNYKCWNTISPVVLSTPPSLSYRINSFLCNPIPCCLSRILLNYFTTCNSSLITFFSTKKIDISFRNILFPDIKNVSSFAEWNIDCFNNTLFLRTFIKQTASYLKTKRYSHCKITKNICLIFETCLG